MSTTTRETAHSLRPELPSRLVIEGETDQVQFLGWRGFGFRVRAIAHGVVQGCPGWRFRFRESLTVSLLPWRLTNWGLMTLETPHGELAVGFIGRVKVLQRRVVGRCTVIGVRGELADIRARGVYEGDAGLRFQVTFDIDWPDRPACPTAAPGV